MTMQQQILGSQGGTFLKMRGRDMLNDLKGLGHEYREVFVVSMSPEEKDSAMLLALQELDENVKQRQAEDYALESSRSTPLVKLEYAALPTDLEHDDAAENVTMVHRKPATLSIADFMVPKFSPSVGNPSATTPLDWPIMLKTLRKDGSFKVHRITDSNFSLIGGRLAPLFKKTIRSLLEEAKVGKTITEPMEGYTTTACCVRSSILGGVKIASGKHMNFEFEADAGCIARNLPCGHIATHKGEFVVFIVPLPEKLRVGKFPTDEGYWILQTRDKQKRQQGPHRSTQSRHVQMSLPAYFGNGH